MTQCPICGEVIPDPQPRDYSDQHQFNCHRCGRFVATMITQTKISRLTWAQRALLSHRVRRMQRGGEYAVAVFENTWDSFRLDEPLPNAHEQADSLILWVGDNQISPETGAELSSPLVSAWIGANITPNAPTAGIGWLLRQQEVISLILRGPSANGTELLRLTMAGWARYQELKHQRVESRTAFMAMKFGDPELDGVVKDHFKPAVAQAGFELRLLTDSQPAGLIDDQLRVSLRRARFVIADLTHANNGAYWEAGFAEGLGRPVIYTCRKEEWEERKTHFDTNHMNTILWNPANPTEAADKLTATIRATLPDEATMTEVV